MQILAVIGWFVVGFVLGAIGVYNVLRAEAESGWISFGSDMYETRLIDGGQDGTDPTEPSF